MKHAFRRSFRPFAAALLGAASIVSAQPADGAIAALLSESGPDVALYDQMGAEWARLFAGKQVDKILTIESSGIST